MANGIKSLNPDKQKRNPISRGLRSLANKIRGGIGGIHNLAPLFLGERSETGYIPEISEAIYNAVTPDYGDFVGRLSEVPVTQLKDAMGRIMRDDPGSISREVRPDPEEDAWRLYLGLPQLHDTYTESQHRPSIGSGEDVRYMDFANQFDMARRLGHLQPLQDRRPTQYDLEDLVKEIQGSPTGTLNRSTLATLDTPFGDPMGTYTLDLGEDERGPYVSYYDKYDLDVPSIGAIPFLDPSKIAKAGQAFDIYGRMYYDPETYTYKQGRR
jgi:hypothetical protein